VFCSRREGRNGGRFSLVLCDEICMLVAQRMSGERALASRAREGKERVPGCGIGACNPFSAQKSVRLPATEEAVTWGQDRATAVEVGCSFVGESLCNIDEDNDESFATHI